VQTLARQEGRQGFSAGAGLMSLLRPVQGSLCPLDAEALPQGPEQAQHRNRTIFLQTHACPYMGAGSCMHVHEHARACMHPCTHMNPSKHPHAHAHTCTDARAQVRLHSHGGCAQALIVHFLAAPPSPRSCACLPQAKIDESIRTLKLEVEMAVRQVKGAVGDKEKALVDHDVMKLVGGVGCKPPASTYLTPCGTVQARVEIHGAGGCAFGHCQCRRSSRMPQSWDCPWERVLLTTRPSLVLGGPSSAHWMRQVGGPGARGDTDALGCPGASSGTAAACVMGGTMWGRRPGRAMAAQGIWSSLGCGSACRGSGPSIQHKRACAAPCPFAVLCT